MRKILKTFVALLELIIVVFSLAACDLLLNDDLQNDTTDLKKNKNAILYIDKNTIENDHINIKLNEPGCYGSNNNYMINLIITITNKEYKTNIYKIKNAEIIKESTNASYTVNYTEELSVDAEMSQITYFIAYIPNSIEDEKFKLCFELDSYKITYYLYETPDELREDKKVSYYIGDNLVYSEIIKEGRTIESPYIYEFDDGQNYCDTWYTDITCKKKFSLSNKISSDINLYGLKKSNIEWSLYSSNIYSQISGINHVPSNGVLVIPERYENREICIGLYAIRNINVRSIYIPKTVRVIYNGNFTGMVGTTIYYEGSKEEWEKAFYSSSSIYTTGVRYNTKYAK